MANDNKAHLGYRYWEAHNSISGAKFNYTIYLGDITGVTEEDDRHSETDYYADPRTLAHTIQSDYAGNRSEYTECVVYVDKNLKTHKVCAIHKEEEYPGSGRLAHYYIECPTDEEIKNLRDVVLKNEGRTPAKLAQALAKTIQLECKIDKIKTELSYAYGTADQVSYFGPEEQANELWDEYYDYRKEAEEKLDKLYTDLDRAEMELRRREMVFYATE